MLLADNETKVDLLNNEAVAKTVIGLSQDGSLRRPETRPGGDQVSHVIVELDVHGRLRRPESDKL